jgi:hypothetical protein
MGPTALLNLPYLIEQLRSNEALLLSVSSHHENVFLDTRRSSYTGIADISRLIVS